MVTGVSPRPASNRLLLRGSPFLGTLQIGIGLFQSVVGMMILISPHQFASATYAAMQDQLALWGTAFLMFGMGLIAVAFLSPPFWIRVIAHVLSGATLMVVAYGIGLAGGWTGTANLGIAGLGTAVAPLVDRGNSRRGREEGTRADWLAAVVALGAVLCGATIVTMPDQFTSPVYDVIRPFLSLIGVAFLTAGAALAAVQLLQPVPRAVFWAAHLMAGLVLILFFLVSAWPLRAWVGMAYYGGFRVLLALLPWLNVHVHEVDHKSLRVRVAMALAAIAVIPLLVVTSYALSRQEQATISVSLAQQRTLAISIAHSVSDYVALNRDMVEGLAAQPGLMQASRETQHGILGATHSAYPGVLAIALYDASGRQIARSDDSPLTTTTTPLIDRVRRTGQPAVVTQISPTRHRPVVGIAAPVADRAGTVVGAVSTAVDASTMEEMLAHAASSDQVNAYLVNLDGRVIAHPNSVLVANSTDLSGQPAVAAMESDKGISGATVYGNSPAVTLAGYARVPELEWGVVVEQPLSAVLSATRAERDMAFLAMLIVAAVAASAGFVAADRMVRPLRVLMNSVGQISEGKPNIALPASGVSEVAALSDAIRRMRDDLEAAHSERESFLSGIKRRTAELEAILEQMPSGLLIVEVPSGRLIMKNSRLDRIFQGSALGTSEGGDGASRNRSYVDEHPHDLAEWPMFRSIARGEPINDEDVEIRRGDGSVRTVQVSAASIRTEDGRAQAAVAIVTDVTERRRSEETIRKMSRAVEQSPSTVVITSTDGRIEYVNPRFTELTGFTPEEAMGQSPGILKSGRTSREEYQELWKTIRAGRVWRGEFLNKKKNGELYWEEASISPIISPTGEITHFVAVKQDITEQKAAEEKLGRLLAQLKATNSQLVEANLLSAKMAREAELRAIELDIVIENTHAQLAVLDPDFNFVMVNSAYVAGSGHTREELLGRSHFELFPSEENKSIFERVRDSGTPYQALEKPFEYSDQPDRGVTYWNWTLVPIRGENGEVESLLFTLLDVTAHVQARQQTEAAVKMRDEFISIAAHELKTPVTSLRGFAQLTQRQLAKSGSVDPERLATAMERIDQQSKRLTQLTDQLLDLSRLQSGKLTLTRLQIDLSVLLQRVVADMLTTDPERSIRVDSQASLPAFVDPLRIEQVMVNLLNNALKFSPADTDVQVELGESEDGWARLAVRDRGIGIPPEKRDRVFERFFQAHPERHFGGMGIGLFVTRQIVEMHGGTIEVEQPEDGGSRFVVRMPVSGNDQSQTP